MTSQGSLPALFTISRSPLLDFCDCVLPQIPKPAIVHSYILLIGFSEATSDKMSHSAPFRQRPNLHLALVQSTGSPRHSSHSTPLRTPSGTPASTPNGTPLGTTSYSPFPSAGPTRIPTPYSSSLSLPPRRPSKTRQKQFKWSSCKHLLCCRYLLLYFLVSALVIWVLNSGSNGLSRVKISASDLGRDYLLQRRMHNYQFYPAANPKIHVSSVKIDIRVSKY